MNTKLGLMTSGGSIRRNRHSSLSFQVRLSLHPHLVGRMSGIALCFALTVSSLVKNVSAQPFDELVIFGDSGVDTGNWWAGHIPPPENIGGRYSNGPVWVEELAVQFGLQWPRPSEVGGTNYAWGGARTGYGMAWVPQLGLHIPTVGWQIDQFLSQHVPNPLQLFVIRAGGNDFGLHNVTDVAEPLSNIVSHVSDLAAAGASNFVVSTLEPYGYIPMYLGTPNEVAANQFVEDFNLQLAPQMIALEELLGITIHQVDMYHVIMDVLNDPSAFRITNTTDPAWQEGTVVSNPEEYLFWDDVHFSTTMHRIMGEVAAETVATRLQPVTLAQSPESIYSVVDLASEGGLDDQGDGIQYLRLTDPAYIGESMDVGMARIIAKFELPDPADFGGVLDRAVLRFFLRAVAGVPPIEVSVLHNPGCIRRC